MRLLYRPRLLPCFGLIFTSFDCYFSILGSSPKRDEVLYNTGGLMFVHLSVGSCHLVFTDSWPERADFRPERVDSRPEKADFRPERAWGGDGRTNGRTNGWTGRQTKVPLCSTGHCPLRGRCPASPHSNSQSGKAGQRVSLTTYCPWATCYSLKFELQTSDLPSRPQ